MSFRSVFIAIFIGTAMVLAALVVNARRPAAELAGPTPEFVRATGRCAECHLNETSAIVWQYETSQHAAASVSCFDCHRALDSQPGSDHNGFSIVAQVTSANCRQCHTTEYNQYERSRHALPAWAAVLGTEGMTADMVALGELYHPGAVDRPANELARLEGVSATETGCVACHEIGRPNADGSIGNCTECHSRHSTSIALAREPQTCGQCHMGPDHAQIEIYNESKHGVLYNAQKGSMNLRAEPKQLTTRDMPVPTCATCHMSGLEGRAVTHDTTERLSYWLFAAISEPRPNYRQGQVEMKEICLKCHAQTPCRPLLPGSRGRSRLDQREGASGRADHHRAAHRGALVAPSHSTRRSSSSTSTPGTILAARRSTAPSWEAPTSCSGTAIMSCS